MKKCLYSLSLQRADYKIFEVKKNKKISYLTEITEEVCFNYGGEMRVTTYINNDFRSAVSRLTCEVRKRLDEHIHLECCPLPL